MRDYQTAISRDGDTYTIGFFDELNPDLAAPGFYYLTPSLSWDGGANMIGYVGCGPFPNLAEAVDWYTDTGNEETSADQILYVRGTGVYASHAFIHTGYKGTAKRRDGV